jgi:enoyl-[acyl-carrier protein] reductase II
LRIRSRVCEILDIDYPIIQGGMAWVATAELAAAVSDAGGLGIIGAGSMPPEVLRKEIRKAKSLTEKPFGVNLVLIQPHVEDLVQVILEEGVFAVSTGAGNPGPFISPLKKKGIKVLPVVPSVALAKRVERQGADIVIVEGTEAGGHVGTLTTMVLVPQVVDAVEIPVVAAGGIADGRGFLAALALGAEGVQMGTRFVCSKECPVHSNYKEALVKAGDRATVVTGQSIGAPVRVIKNKLTKIYEKWEKDFLDGRRTKEEIEELGVGRLRMAAKEGNVEEGSVMAGQIAGLIKDIKPVEEIIDGILEEFQKILEEVGERILT